MLFLVCSHKINAILILKEENRIFVLVGFGGRSSEWRTRRFLVPSRGGGRAVGAGGLLVLQWLRNVINEHRAQTSTSPNPTSLNIKGDLGGWRWAAGSSGGGAVPGLGSAAGRTDRYTLSTPKKYTNLLQALNNHHRHYTASVCLQVWGKCCAALDWDFTGTLPDTEDEVLLQNLLYFRSQGAVSFLHHPKPSIHHLRV